MYLFLRKELTSCYQKLHSFSTNNLPGHCLGNSAHWFATRVFYISRGHRPVACCLGQAHRYVLLGPQHTLKFKTFHGLTSPGRLRHQTPSRQLPGMGGQARMDPLPDSRWKSSRSQHRGVSLMQRPVVLGTSTSWLFPQQGRVTHSRTVTALGEIRKRAQACQLRGAVTRCHRTGWGPQEKESDARPPADLSAGPLLARPDGDLLLSPGDGVGAPNRRPAVPGAPTQAAARAGGSQ